jgi:hypothetical protein
MNMKALALICAVFALLAPAPANATCRAPNLESLVGPNVIGCCDVRTQPVGPIGSRLLWVAVSWEGPPEGRLFVVNCEGHKVADDESIGYVEGIEAGPRIGGEQTVEVTYTSAAGTNIKARAVALVQFRRGRIRFLWRHATLDAGFHPLTPVDEEDRTSWRFGNGVQKIDAITTHEEGGRVRWRKVERYCLRRNVLRYIRCARN